MENILIIEVIRLTCDFCFAHLIQKPHGNPGAFYTCALCDVVLESIPHAYKHIRDKRHKKKAQVRSFTVYATTAVTIF